jgi:hypothetical protein
MQTTSLDERRTLKAVSAKSPARFRSILFDAADEGVSGESAETPDYFRDLNLDQIVDAITAGRDEYNLKPFFCRRLTNLALITYRQEIMRDLEDGVLFQSVKSFAERMRMMRTNLTVAKDRDFKYEKEAWFVEAVESYGGAVTNLRDDLHQREPHSRGLLEFRDYLTEYAESDRFKTLVTQARKVKTDLSRIRYCLLIKGDTVIVRNYEGESDYSVDVEQTFAKFKQGAVTDYRVKFPPASGLNHVEAMVLDRVALLNPAVFRALDEFCAQHSGFPDDTILTFDREIQFYVAYLEYAATFKSVGLKFCYPRVSDTSKSVSNRDGFDMALAGKLIGEHETVVCNDFALNGDERICVVTGPNQGGKTTFARMFGQLHYLASLGCPVPGSEARLFLFDEMFTHFEREEDITNLRGKLEDDLIRVHHLLEQATPNSVIIINEIFLSTTLKDAVFLSRKILERVSQLDALCVCVTFLDELASLNEKAVSFVAAVNPDNPMLRTYKIERRPADGLAYAHAIAEKYGLTYERLKERIKS